MEITIDFIDLASLAVALYFAFLFGVLYGRGE
jgi:hypothetical protein